VIARGGSAPPPAVAVSVLLSLVLPLRRRVLQTHVVAVVDTLGFRSAHAARTTSRIVDAALGLPRHGGVVEHFGRTLFASDPDGRFAWSAGMVRRAHAGWAYDVVESTAHVLRRRALASGDPVPDWVWAQLPRTHPSPTRFAPFMTDVLRTVLHGLEPSLAWRIEGCALERPRPGRRWTVWSSLTSAEPTPMKLGAALESLGVQSGTDALERETPCAIMRLLETRARPSGAGGDALRWRAFPALLRGRHHDGVVLAGLPMDALRGADHVRGRGDLDWAFASFVEAGAFLCGVNLARRLPNVQPMSPDDLDALAPNARVAQLYLAGLLAPLAEVPPTHRVFDSLSAIASRTYEGREAEGRIVLAPPGASGLTMRLPFRDAARLDDTKLVRKLLEAAKDGLALCSDGEVAHALVEIDAARLPRSEAFVVELDGRDAWNFYAPARRHPMLVVHRGIARAPRESQSPALARSLRRAFPIEREAIKRFDSVASAMRFAKHGALLVIDPQAFEQAHPDGRPGGEPPLTAAIRTGAPILLTREVAASLAEIDGAMLVDPQCMLYAAGVILDGDEADRLDELESARARGARYSSAWRYASKRERQGVSVVIVLVSQDGDIDVVCREDLLGTRR
jgi:DNA integrity scanning protein DisA with diadenylate cyclase activity